MRVTRRLAWLLLAWVPGAWGWALDLDGYLQPDGAITVERDGDAVDPYFALKALIVARMFGASGASVTAPLRRFVGWLLPRAAADGRIGRYTRQVDGHWIAARGADADDVALALWIQALLGAAAGRALRAPEQRALARAERYLELRLYDPARGVYRVFADDDDPLLMDNVEILAAQRAIARLLRERGDLAGARRWQQRSERLAPAIELVFAGVDTLAPAVTAGAAPSDQDPAQDRDHDQAGRGDAENGRDRSGAGGATQATNAATAFYPFAVAAPFAWLHGAPRHRAVARFDAWLARNGQAWRDNAQHDYPWGLIALAAVEEGRPDIAARWRQAQDQQRSSGQWNVLEEAAWQALASR